MTVEAEVVKVRRITSRITDFLEFTLRTIVIAGMDASQSSSTISKLNATLYLSRPHM